MGAGCVHLGSASKFTYTDGSRPHGPLHRMASQSGSCLPPEWVIQERMQEVTMEATVFLEPHLGNDVPLPLPHSVGWKHSIQSILMGRGLYKGMNIKVGSQGTILEAAYNSNSCFHLYLLSTCRWIPMYPSMGLPDTSLGCLIGILSFIWKNGPPQHLLFPVFSILVNGSSILRDDWVKNLERSFTRFFLLYHLSAWPSR